MLQLVELQETNKQILVELHAERRKKATVSKLLNPLQKFVFFYFLNLY